MPKLRHPEQAGLHVRIVLGDGVAFGPGRAELLGKIRDLGSIAAAARGMGMSYRRAWMLVDETAREFGGPMVAAKSGGVQGGRAELTALGAAVLELYRAVETKAADAVAAELDALRKLASRVE